MREHGEWEMHMDFKVGAAVRNEEVEHEMEETGFYLILVHFIQLYRGDGDFKGV